MSAPQPFASPAPSRSAFRVELGATLRLSGPLALANMLQMAVYAIDVIFVARLGQEALAASSLGVSLFVLIVFGCTGLTGAVAPLVAAELGRRRHAVREIRRSVRMAMWLAVGCGLAGMVICLAGESLLLLTGQDPAVAALAARFLAVLAFCLVPMLVSNVLRTFVATMGRPVFATLITALAIGVNALGNYMFVFGRLGAPALGLEGSALSSVITAVATVAAYAIAIGADRRLRRFRIFGRWWRPEWSRLREIVRVGLPIGMTLVAEAGLFSGAAFLMGRIGAAELAAHTVALQIAAFFFQVPFGVAQAATIRVGYHFGAGDAAAIARAGQAALAIGFAFVGISASAMLFVPELILSAYVDVAAPANAGRSARRSSCSTGRRPLPPGCCAACRIRACRWSSRWRDTGCPASAPPWRWACSPRCAARACGLGWRWGWSSWRCCCCGAGTAARRWAWSASPRPEDSLRPEEILHALLDGSAGQTHMRVAGTLVMRVPIHSGSLV
jgi:MATE family multidrug resistance protein